MVLNKGITVCQYLPVLDQETVGIIIGLVLQVPDFPLGHQLTVNRSAGADQFLRSIAGKRIGPFLSGQLGAIDLNILRYVGRDQVIVVA
ncbi:MAG: hypothetical protein JWQ01_4630 [Massilia sp.]|nr:hypothetical protein [Massilia sp.]